MVDHRIILIKSEVSFHSVIVRARPAKFYQHVSLMINLRQLLKEKRERQRDLFSRVNAPVTGQVIQHNSSQ